MQTDSIRTSAIQKIIDTGKFFGITGLPNRIGFSKFVIRTEYDLYSPHGDDNDKFQMFIIDFIDLKWILILVPIEDRDKAEKIATECGLKFVDGIPTCFGLSGKEVFPIRHNNLWSVENLPDSDAYDPEKRPLREQEEKDWIDAFFKEQTDILRSQIPKWAKDLPFASSSIEGIPSECLIDSIPVGCVISTDENKPVVKGTWHQCRTWARQKNKEKLQEGKEPCYIAMSWKDCRKEGIS